MIDTAHEKDRDRLLAVASETGARTVLQHRADSAKRISRAEFRATSHAFCRSRGSTRSKENSESNSRATDPADRAWRNVLGKIHENALRPF